MIGSGNILIVDSDDDHGRSAALFLGERGYRCDCTTDTEQAEQMLRRKPYDVLIVDVNMPGSLGSGLIKRAQAIVQGISVVVVTGSASLDSVTDTIGLPVTACLTKPVALEKLLEHVQASVHSSQARRAVAMAHELLASATGHLEDLERLLVRPQGDRPPDSLSEILSRTLQNLVGGLSELQDLRVKFACDDCCLDICQRTDCARRAEYEEAILEAIKVIEQARSSHGSQELGGLRDKLKRTLEDPRRCPMIRSNALQRRVGGNRLQRRDDRPIEESG
jgi:DNA-binding response OmpR family regulator